MGEEYGRYSPLTVGPWKLESSQTNGQSVTDLEHKFDTMATTTVPCGTSPQPEIFNSHKQEK